MFGFDNYVMSEYELQRERNIKERDALFAQMEAEEAGFADVDEAIKAIKDYSESVNPHKPKSTPKRRRTTGSDPSFSFKGKKPAERRRSSRLANQNPQFNYKELPEKGSIKTYTHDSDEENRNIKRVKPKPRPQVDLSGTLRSREITEEDIKKIAHRTSEKVYSINGTTCHQCRQKTLDTKSFCRNPECLGVQGQVCGPCLRNRYGEDLSETLKNPTWICPYCRNECNCSFCRAREGKTPTGIKAPIALTRGFKSVLHLLAYEENNEGNVENEGDAANIDEGNDSDNVQSTHNSPVSKEKPANKCISPEERRKRQERSKQEEDDLLGFTEKGCCEFS